MAEHTCSPTRPRTCWPWWRGDFHAEIATEQFISLATVKTHVTGC